MDDRFSGPYQHVTFGLDNHILGKTDSLAGPSNTAKLRRWERKGIVKWPPIYIFADGVPSLGPSATFKAHTLLTYTGELS